MTAARRSRTICATGARTCAIAACRIWWRPAAARSSAMPMSCCSASARPTATRSSIRSTSTTSISAAASAGCCCSELIDACAAAGFRQMIGYIDADNAASLALHEKFGFARVGLPARRRLSIRPLGRQRHGAALSRPRHDGAAAGVRLAALIRQLAWMNVPRMLGYTRIAGIDAGHDVFDRAVFADMHADVALLHISMTW